MSSDCVLGLLRRPRTASSAASCAAFGRREATALVRGAEEALHLGVEVRRDEGALEEGVHPRRGWWGTHPEDRGVGGGPLSTHSPLPARRGTHGRGDSCQRGGARVFSFLPVKGQGKDVMPLQMREMRL